MNGLQKILATIGMAQLQVEYLEDILQDPLFGPQFVRELKRDAKNYIRSSDRLITALSNDAGMDVSEEITQLYIAISKLVENHIEWNEKETN